MVALVVLARAVRWFPHHICVRLLIHVFFFFGKRESKRESKLILTLFLILCLYRYVRGGLESARVCEFSDHAAQPDNRSHLLPRAFINDQEITSVIVLGGKKVKQMDFSSFLCECESWGCWKRQRHSEREIV